MEKGKKELAPVKSLNRRKEEKVAYWSLILPGFLIYVFVMAFPTIFGLYLSVTSYKGGPLFGPKKRSVDIVGFKYYAEMFKDSYFWLALKNNMWITFISVFGQIPLGFFMAYLIFRGMIKGKDFFQTVIYLPCVISTVVIGKLWDAIMSPNGALPDIIRIFNPSYVAGNRYLSHYLFGKHAEDRYIHNRGCKDRWCYRVPGSQIHHSSCSQRSYRNILYPGNLWILEEFRPYLRHDRWRTCKADIRTFYLHV